MRFLLPVSLAVAGALLVPAAACASSDQSRLDALVAAGAPGAVLTVRDGDHTAQLSSGVADKARGTKLHPDDRVRIASLTKSFVATVALQLVAEHKLALSDTVERRLPGRVPGGEAITLRRLLNHTSGLAEFELDPRVLEPYLGGDLGHRWAPRDLVEIATSLPPLFPPGTRYGYSNTNYLLTGLIVEAVTGHSLAHELQRRIFTRLHLTRTSLAETAALPSPFAHGYSTQASPELADLSGLYPYSWAAGAIVSNTHDVARFYRALVGGKLLPPRLLRAMKTTVDEGDRAEFPGQAYGLGLESYPTRCGAAWGHSGDIPGYYSYAFTSADGRRQAVLSVNQDAHSLPPAAAAAYLDVLMNAYC